MMPFVYAVMLTGLSEILRVRDATIQAAAEVGWPVNGIA